MNGLLIGIEGIDGCGKSTLAQALAQALSQHNLTPILTREPGGTKFGLQLRQILQYRDELCALDPKAEFLLFAADRAQHFTQLVIPSLQQGKIVISDRTCDSSLIYQGVGRGLDRAMLRQINQWVMGGIKPDLIIYLRVDAQVACNRITQRAEKPTAFEEAGLLFLHKLVAGFDELYQNRSDVLTLDGKLPSGDLAQQSLARILTLVK